MNTVEENSIAKCETRGTLKPSSCFKSNFEVSNPPALPEKKVCRGCGLALFVTCFPVKGVRRRESRCKDCHNSHRRNQYSPKKTQQTDIEDLPVSLEETVDSKKDWTVDVLGILKQQGWIEIKEEEHPDKLLELTSNAVDELINS